MADSDTSSNHNKKIKIDKNKTFAHTMNHGNNNHKYNKARKVPPHKQNKSLFRNHKPNRHINVNNDKRKGRDVETLLNKNLDVIDLLSNRLNNMNVGNDHNVKKLMNDYNELMDKVKNIERQNIDILKKIKSMDDEDNEQNNNDEYNTGKRIKIISLDDFVGGMTNDKDKKEDMDAALMQSVMSGLNPILSKMLNLSSGKKTEEDMTKKIKIPDMERLLYTKVENVEVPNDFVELEINTIDNLIECGEKFMDIIMESNYDSDEEIGTDEIINEGDCERDCDGLYNLYGKKYSVNPKKIMRLVKPLKILNTMIGMNNIKSTMYRIITSSLQNSENNGMMNCAIYGDPGVGKTEVGKILCMIYSALEIVPESKFRIVRASDLVGRYVGETRQKTIKVLNDAEGGILFIDEAYTLNNGKDDACPFGKECIDTINQELSENNKKLVIIIAGYKEHIEQKIFGINPGMDRRFPFKFTLKSYNDEEKSQIFKRMIRLKEYYLADDVNDDDIINLFKDPTKKLFKNHGGDIENLLTHIRYANNETLIGKYSKRLNVFNKSDLNKGLQFYIEHKNHKDSISLNHMYT